MTSAAEVRILERVSWARTSQLGLIKLIKLKMAFIQQNDLSTMIRTTAHLHKALLANGYFLPPLKGAFVT